ncbi:MAG: restriction endonuclease [Promethearchaeota archaeon]
MTDNNSLRKMELFKIVELYCQNRFPGQFKTNVEMRGNTKKWKFDIFIETEEGMKIGIVVKDWIRTLGVNQVREVQKACNDTMLDSGVLITNSLSSSAKSYAERYNISCYSKYDLLKKL